ncbi:hypothetical protein KFE25_008419 [Diacronema lutheri]|uniref:Uncharacterized protein n=2 Tax=Diacronema lutheri TaxID=2081491 RepID=A0A8J5X8U8_DIALT|nr:hypothetical protein KFE25_008419 [Diacronema lutheri]
MLADAARSAAAGLQALATDVIWLLYGLAGLVVAAYLLRARLVPAAAKRYLDLDLRVTELDVDFASLRLADRPLARLLGGDAPLDSLEFAMNDVVLFVMPASPTLAPNAPRRAPHEMLRARRARVRLERTGPLAFDVHVELDAPVLTLVAYDLQFRETNLGWLWERTTGRAARSVPSADRRAGAHAPAEAATEPRARAACGRASGSAQHACPPLATTQPRSAAHALPPTSAPAQALTQTQLRAVRLLGGELRVRLELPVELGGPVETRVPLVDESVPVSALCEASSTAIVRWCAALALQLGATGRADTQGAQMLHALSRIVGGGWRQPGAGEPAALAERAVDVARVASHLAHSAAPLLRAIGASAGGASAGAGRAEQLRAQAQGAVDAAEHVRHAVEHAPARLAAAAGHLEDAVGSLGEAAHLLTTHVAPALDGLTGAGARHAPSPASNVLHSAAACLHGLAATQATAAQLRRQFAAAQPQPRQRPPR